MLMTIFKNYTVLATLLCAQQLQANATWSPLGPTLLQFKDQELFIHPSYNKDLDALCYYLTRLPSKNRFIEDPEKHFENFELIRLEHLSESYVETLSPFALDPKEKTSKRLPFHYVDRMAIETSNKISNSALSTIGNSDVIPGVISVDGSKVTRARTLIDRIAFGALVSGLGVATILESPAIATLLGTAVAVDAWNYAVMKIMKEEIKEKKGEQYASEIKLIDNPISGGIIGQSIFSIYDKLKTKRDSINFEIEKLFIHPAMQLKPEEMNTRSKKNPYLVNVLKINQYATGKMGQGEKYLQRFTERLGKAMLLQDNQMPECPDVASMVNSIE